LELLSQLGDVEIVDCTKIVPGGIKEADLLIPYVKDADAVVIQFANISKTVIDAMQNCKIIVRYAIGVDVIDVAAAHSKGITVSNVPDYCIEEVSDTAVAHILNLFRSISRSNTLLHDRAWSLSAIQPLKRLRDSTIGLIGFGHIARRTADKLREFAAHILAYDPYITDINSYKWVEFVALDTLLSCSDLISIHAPLTNDTKHMIGEREFSLMKDGTYIVNTSRGGLVDEKALIHALNEGKIRGAGLDVLDTPDSAYSDSPLMRYSDRVFVTPHMGWYSEASIIELKKKVANNIISRLVNGKALYEV
jgi:D-3-phosphoglycerate dehydrogenase